MRSGRLLALLLTLQRAGPRTAAQLARELEVSERTVYRDVATLQASGIPLWTETGPGGGIRLLEGWRTTLDGLTSEEVEALFVPGGPAAATELGLGAVLAAAQAKVLSTLSPELAGHATRARERFLLDAPGWFHHDEPTEVLPEVARAVWEGRRLLVHHGREAPGRRRTVDPLGLVLKAGTWYLVAAHRGQPRTWRVGRIHRSVVLDADVRRPADFDLASHWSRATSEFSGSLLACRVHLRVRATAAGRLVRFVDPSAARRALDAAGPADRDGWLTLHLEVESDAVAVDQLLGLGPDVAVLAPAAVRDRLADIGRALVAHHS